jgi:hypothetical protein
MQSEGLRNDRDGVQTEAAKPTDVDDGFSLQSTIGSCKVEEIAGGYLSRWILSHYRELYQRTGTTRASSR